jgi:hypothetical protein
MKKTDLSTPATPTVQVIERMFSLLDILAARESLWAGFTNATKYSIIAVVALLVLMFLFLV